MPEIAEVQTREQSIKATQEEPEQQAQQEEQQPEQNTAEEQNPPANQALWGIINILISIMRSALIIASTWIILVWTFSLKGETILEFVLPVVLICYPLYHVYALFDSFTGRVILEEDYLQQFFKALVAILSGLGIVACIVILLIFSDDGIYDDEEGWGRVALLSFSAIAVMLADYRKIKNVLDIIIFSAGLILLIGWLFGMMEFLANYQARP